MCSLSRIVMHGAPGVRTSCKPAGHRMWAGNSMRPQYAPTRSKLLRLGEFEFSVDAGALGHIHPPAVSDPVYDRQSAPAQRVFVEVDGLERCPGPGVQDTQFQQAVVDRP